MTYDETMDAFREMMSLGYSVKETIHQLDEDGDKNALKELKNAQTYGV